MNKLKVINICDTDYLKTWQLPSNSVYVGRAVPRKYKLKESKWCNPPENKIPRNAPLAKRLEAIEKFRTHLMSKPELLAQIGELRGKDLVCWCAPKPCHADILLELANHEDIQT